LEQGAVDSDQADLFESGSLAEEPDLTPSSASDSAQEPSFHQHSLKALEQELKEALNDEDYEKAAQIRDLIQNRRKSGEA
jgi:excinuclease UvrABC helicase subunit UvrB